MNLQIERLSKQYGSKIAVDRVSATFEPGIYGLLGANGSGKTTLMRIICGVLRPTAGEITFNGKDVVALGEQYRDVLGYLPQEFGYYPNFTALEFMRYIAALKGINKTIEKRRCMELLEQVGLDDCAKNKIKTFSGGMKQRLGIAQAVINDPKVLILDEPTAGLDPQERVRFRNLISNLSQDRIVILSTHIVSDVEYIAGSILVMKKGAFLLQGSPIELEHEVCGKVWEVVVAPSEVEVYSQHMCVGNIYHANEREAVLRVIANQKPSDTAQSVNPTLEDLYLYLFSDDQTAAQDTLAYAAKAVFKSTMTTRGEDHDEPYQI